MQHKTPRTWVYALSGTLLAGIILLAPLSEATAQTSLEGLRGRLEALARQLNALQEEFGSFASSTKGKNNGNKNNGNGNGKRDAQTLVISEVVTLAQDTSATIRWNTNKESWGTLRYKRMAPAVDSAERRADDGSLAKKHALLLSGLSPASEYRFVIAAADRAGNTIESHAFFFETAASTSGTGTTTPPVCTPPTPAPDTTAPSIVASFPRSIASTSARIWWVTDEASDSRLWVGTTTPIDTSSAPYASSTLPLFYHEVEVIGLEPNTEYAYTAASRDSVGNTGIKRDSVFRTLGP